MPLLLLINAPRSQSCEAPLLTSPNHPSPPMTQLFDLYELNNLESLSSEIEERINNILDRLDVLVKRNEELENKLLFSRKPISKPLGASN